MSIDEAARATRRYAVHYAHGEPYWVVCKIGERRRIRGPGAMTAYTTEAEAQAACDRLNLVAVLEALQEPSEAMVDAGWIDKEDVNPDDIWRAMIDALLAEVKETTDVR